MSTAGAPEADAGWEHAIIPLTPAEVASLQRDYVAALPVPTLSDLDLRLRDGIRPVGVKVGSQPVAFALIQPHPVEGLPAPLLVAIAAPGQSSIELRRFFREVVRQHHIAAIWGRSDDALLLEVLMLEGWRFQPMGPLLIVDDLTPAPVMEGIELRHLTPADLEIVAQLYARIPEAEGGLRDRNEIRKLLQDHVLDGLLEGESLRAVVQLIPQHHPQYVSFTVAVDPEHRRRGFARLLAADAAAEEIAADRQVIAAFGVGDSSSRRLVESIGARVAASYYLAAPA